jgi:ankyrin repeat protein
MEREEPIEKKQRTSDGDEQEAASAKGVEAAPAAPAQLIPAANIGDEGTVASALRHPHTDPNMKDNWGMTALYRAVQYVRKPVVAVLLADVRVDVDVASSDGLTALALSARNGQDALAALLLAGGRADPNKADRDGRTPLMHAAHRRSTSVVVALLADDRLDPNALDASSQTALDFAARSCSKTVLKLLLADGRTTRTRPAYRGEYFDAALACLDREGTDVEAAPEEFIPAARDGDDATVASALRNPLIDPNMTNEYGNTAVIVGAINQRSAVLKVLLADKRVNPNIAGDRGVTALMLAARREDTSMLELLLADHRTTRTRPPDNWPRPQAAYDTALLAVKRPRNARFRGLTRLMVIFRRMRLRAAQTVYAPGGAGFAAAAASFHAAAATAAATTTQIP